MHNLLLDPLSNFDMGVNGRAGVLSRQLRSSAEVGVIVVGFVVFYHVVQIWLAVALVAYLAAIVMLVDFRPLGRVVLLLAESSLQRLLLILHVLLLMVDVQGDDGDVNQYEHHHECEHHDH